MKRSVLLLSTVFLIACSLAFAGEPMKIQLIDSKDMKPTKEFKLFKAVYGTKEKQKDLTKEFLEAFGKKEKFAANNRFGDPAVGTFKKLEVVYSVNGRLKAVSVNEGQSLDTQILK